MQAGRRSQGEKWYFVPEIMLIYDTKMAWSVDIRPILATLNSSPPIRKRACLIFAREKKLGEFRIVT